MKSFLKGIVTSYINYLLIKAS